MGKPEIRFKGYTDEWEQRKLGELVKEGILEAPLDGNHGEKHPTSDEYVESGIPFLMASDIHNGEVNIYSCKYITKERAERLDKGFARNGDVLLTHKATIGETAILSNLMTEYAMLTPQVTYYRIKNEERLNREYLYSFFNSLDFQTELKTKAAQSTRPYIGITAQQNLKIILPTEIDEQRKIGLYFGNLDRLITLHQRKCDEVKSLKKYMLQKMFPQNEQKVPEIRFEGFTEAWEQRKLGELVKEGILEAPLDGNHGEKHPTSDEYVESGIPFLMASDIHNGEVNIYSCKYITKERAERLDKGFARNGDVLLTHKATIGETAILSNLMTEYAMLTPQVTYYRIKNEERLNREYLYSFFNSLDFQTELKTKAAQSTRPYIGITAQQNLKIILPTEIDEQRKIGLYFGNLDRLITLHQRKCDEVKSLKKYMLQKMFPQNEQKVPEIRFEGFTEAWEQRKLGDLVDRVTRKNQDLVSELPLTISAQYGLIDQNEFFDKRVASKDVSGYYLIENGEFAYNKSTSTDAPWGAIKRLDRYENGVLSTLYIVFGIKENNPVDSDFLVSYYSTNLWHKGIHEIAAEGARNHGLLNIAPADFFETKLMIPQDIEEQKKIGKYFEELERLITLHQQKCEELKKIKKFMLQKMFV